MASKKSTFLKVFIKYPKSEKNLKFRFFRVLFLVHFLIFLFKF